MPVITSASNKRFGLIEISQRGMKESKALGGALKF
jgi:hypothetical protein